MIEIHLYDRINHSGKLILSDEIVDQNRRSIISVLKVRLFYRCKFGSPISAPIDANSFRCKFAPLFRANSWLLSMQILGSFRCEFAAPFDSNWWKFVAPVVSVQFCGSFRCKFTASRDQNSMKIRLSYCRKFAFHSQKLYKIKNLTFLRCETEILSLEFSHFCSFSD